MEGIFKRCTFCGKEWMTKEDFLQDRDNYLDGYQVIRKRLLAGLPAEGLLIFTHRISSCGTSLAIPAAKFRDEAEPVIVAVR
jgi:hypothetical protein